jgi:hypothetical protein
LVRRNVDRRDGFVDRLLAGRRRGPEAPLYCKNLTEAAFGGLFASEKTLTAIRASRAGGLLDGRALRPNIGGDLSA